MSNESPEGYTAVGIAVICLWVTQALVLVSAIASRATPHMMAVLSPRELLFVRVFSVGLTLAFYAWLIIKIAGGRNWARITYLVFFLIATPFYLLLSVAVFRHFSVGAMVPLLEFCLTLFAMISLFTAPGKYWFTRS